MKQIIIILAMLLLCGTAAANTPNTEHYIITVIIWDNTTGLPEADVPVTFGGIHIFYTETDGSVIYDTANLKNVEDGSFVSVSCKYGLENVLIDYYRTEKGHHWYEDGYHYYQVRNSGKGITFNEPSEIVAIEAFAAMGFAVVIALGGGRYILRRKKKIIKQEDTMTEEKEEWKLKRDFGVRALIATLTVLGYIGVTGLAVYKGDMNMLESISVVFLPIVMAMIVFYFNGSAIRDAVHK